MFDVAPKSIRGLCQAVLDHPHGDLGAIAGTEFVADVVDKRREIYFAGNVKIHLDRVRGLGRFVEVEAISRSRKVKKIREQARRFQVLFAIAESDDVQAMGKWALAWNDLLPMDVRPALDDQGIGAVLTSGQS